MHAELLCISGGHSSSRGKGLVQSAHILPIGKAKLAIKNRGWLPLAPRRVHGHSAVIQMQKRPELKAWIGPERVKGP